MKINNPEESSIVHGWNIKMAAISGGTGLATGTAVLTFFLVASTDKKPNFQNITELESTSFLYISFMTLISTGKCHYILRLYFKMIKNSNVIWKIKLNQG